MLRFRVPKLNPFLALFSLIFIFRCLNNSDGHRLELKNPDNLKPDTDSIEVYIVYTHKGKEKEELLYSGKAGDDGFEGPYTGEIKNYDGGDYKLRIIQFSKELRDTLSVTNTTFSEGDKKGDLSVEMDLDLNYEKIVSVKILKDSSKAFGTYSHYHYKNLKDTLTDSIHIYNGDLKKLSKREPSAVVELIYGEQGVKEVKVRGTNISKIDSTLEYDEQNRLKKIRIKTGNHQEELRFKYKDSEPAPYETQHYNFPDDLDRLVTHTYNKAGHITRDSVFLLDGERRTLKRRIKYIYRDDTLRIEEKIYQQREKLELDRSIKFFYDEDSKYLTKMEKWEEGGVPLLSESFTFKNSRLGNPERVIQANENEDLINYYVYQYDTIPYENTAAKMAAARPPGSRDIIARIPGWCLKNFKCY